MKKILFFILALVISTTQIFAVVENSDNVVRIQCKGDQTKKTSKNEVAGAIFTFTIKGNQLYDREGKLLSNAKVTDEEIKGKIKYRHGFSWENTRFLINRYTGAFNYHTIYRTLESYQEIRNTGMCSKVENEQKF